MGGWFNKEINSVDDLKGLKMRIPGLGGEVLKRAGGTPVNLPGGELFTSLKTGAIDATEWVGPWNDRFMKFYEAAKYYYYPGMHEPGSMLSLGMSKKFWDKLSKSDQLLIDGRVETLCIFIAVRLDHLGEPFDPGARLHISSRARPSQLAVGNTFRISAIDRRPAQAA